MVKDVLHSCEDRMKKAIDALEADLSAIRTGRASPALVERLQVSYYGTPTPLMQLAVISAPEPSLLTIRPYDPGSMKDIERAILASDLGLTPNNDGKLIRLNLPPLTEQRRQELSKVVHRRLEDTRVAIRNVRREGMDDLKELEKEKLISEDDLDHGKDELQKLTDKYVERVAQTGDRKQKEIMEL